MKNLDFYCKLLKPMKENLKKWNKILQNSSELSVKGQRFCVEEQNLWFEATSAFLVPEAWFGNWNGFYVSVFFLESFLSVKKICLNWNQSPHLPLHPRIQQPDKQEAKMPKSDTWPGEPGPDTMKASDSAGSCDSFLSGNSGLVSTHSFLSFQKKR